MSAITPGESTGQNTRDPRDVYEPRGYSYHHEVIPYLELLFLLPYLVEKYMYVV
jgi:hypothetical protein